VAGAVMIEISWLAFVAFNIASLSIGWCMAAVLVRR
jgi:hypothetical protein